LTSDWQKKYSSHKILTECETIEEAAQLEYLLIKLLSNKIDSRQIDNRVAGGGFVHNRHTNK